MAVTVSGMYYPTFRDGLQNLIVLDLNAETHKIAMYTNAITPNFSTDTAYTTAPYTTNEVTGTGYTAGGNTLINTTVSESPVGALMWTASNPSWATSTITNARCAYIYASALSGKNGIVLVNFGADYSTSAGTFSIQWAATGIAAIDLTP